MFVSRGKSLFASRPFFVANVVCVTIAFLAANVVCVTIAVFVANAVVDARYHRRRPRRRPLLLRIRLSGDVGHDPSVRSSSCSAPSWSSSVLF